MAVAGSTKLAKVQTVLFGSLLLRYERVVYYPYNNVLLTVVDGTKD